MTTTKVSSIIDIEKLKTEKALTAKKCCVDGCDKIGSWKNKSMSYCLELGMCSMHIQRFRKSGDVNKVKHFKNGQTKHPLYGIYNGLKDRTLNEKDYMYYRYGGRGIKVCDEWLDPINGFWQFVDDMGERPKGFSIERKENDKGYSKDNCIWANVHTQTANRCTNNKNVGVSLIKIKGRIYGWDSQLMVNGKVYRKTFKTEIEAINYRQQLEKEHNIYI